MERMENEAQDGRKQRYSLRRSIMDYGMGVIFCAMGIIILLAPKIGVNVNLDPMQRYLFTGLFLLYGGFRLYRGSRKNYYN